MSRTEELLKERYAEHYQRGNLRDIAPDKLCDEAACDRWFGKLVAPFPPGSQVLDLGCGTGHLLYWLSKQKGILPCGVDQSPAQVEIARRGLPNVEVACEPGVEFLRKNPGRFQAVFCLDMIEHIRELDDCLELLETAREALVPGGVFYCRTGNAANLFGFYMRCLDLTHYRGFTGASLRQLFEVAGYQDIAVHSVAGASLASRARSVVEHAAHKVLHRMCASKIETVFSMTFALTGRRGP